ncbi:MAG: EAL domain-containing protein [Candidatus Velthaea sp.]
MQLELEELRERTFYKIVHPDDLVMVKTTVKQLLSGSAGIEAETRLVRKDGSTAWVRQHRSLVRGAAGEPLFFLTHTEDISQRKLDDAAVAAARGIAEDALRRSEARYRLLADHVGDMIVHTRADRTRLYVSPASFTLLGFKPAELLHLDFLTFVHPDDRERVAARYAEFISSREPTMEMYRLRRKDGSYVWIEAKWMPAADDPLEKSNAEKSPGIVSIVRDISDRKAAEEKIEFMAHHDALTGLASRRLFQDRIEKAVGVSETGGGCCAILFIDLDRFKSINDNFGHAVGDALLRAVAAQLVACVRPLDLVARLGGDEFAILLHLERPEDAESFAQRIVDLIHQPYEIMGHHISVGASVGISACPRDGLDADTLLVSADTALYRAKAEGRSTYRFFDFAMGVQVRARRDLQSELRQSLDTSAFHLIYQAIVDIATREITSFEALLRWHHPRLGVILPADFIPVAEEMGLISVLDDWLLRQACRDAATWPAHLKVALRLSAVQFRTGDIVAAIANALADSGLSACRLEVGISETATLVQDAAVLASVRELRHIGVSITFADFGTGYSALGFLSRIPFDKIKIDKLFARDLPAKRHSVAIVRAIAGLGKELGIVTVVDGIETREQFESVRMAGCTQAQGDFLSSPRNAEEIPGLLAALSRPVRA